MRRKDREMPVDFALQVADRCTYASLATVDEDGLPYCVPLSIVRDGDRLYFHCAKEGKKTDNLRVQPHVCVSCVAWVHPLQNEFSVEYESAILTGTAREVTEEKAKLAALRLLCERHAPEHMAFFEAEALPDVPRTAVWEIRIEAATGKRKRYDANGVEMKFGRME